MLLNFEILKEFGSTPEALKKLFTAEAGSDLYSKRKAWEDRIANRLREGASFNLKNYQLFAVSDLAWDSNLITKELVPLQMYAQGKIDFKQVLPILNDISPDTVKKFVKFDEKNQPVGVDIPDFHKVVVSLVRSFVTRRTSAIATRYLSLFPFLKYEPFSTSYVARLRADVLSQRIEMISNAYNYRHDLVQNIRGMLLYPYQMEFVSCSWDRDIQLRVPRRDGMSTRDSSGKLIVESHTAREGVPFVQPHPSRVFWDRAHPLASINSDTGCEFIGYWHVGKYGSVRNNTRYYNRESICYSVPFLRELSGYASYWALYFANSPINFPDGGSGGVDVPGSNDREKNIGRYSGQQDDASVLLTEYFEKVVPKAAGFGDYPYPVWTRLIVAGDNTVVFAEPLPSTPAIYYGFNNHDGRLVNCSFAHDALSYQDQLSNMLSNLLHAQKAALIKLIALDMDQIPQNVRDSIHAIVEGGSLYTRPLLVEYKGSLAAEVGVNPRAAVQVSETSAIQDVTTYFRSILQLLSIAERMLGVSAFENAQSEPREVSATESVNISQTVNTSLAFMSLGVDEAVDAKKRLLYEALLGCCTSKVTVPVAGHYQKSTVEAAGFKVIDEATEGAGFDSNYATPEKVTVTGELAALEYDYVFTSRDGSERAASPKSAEILVNLLAQLKQLGVLESLGKERVYGLLNAIARMLDVGVDLQFEVQDGEDKAMPAGDAITDNKAQLESVIQQIVQAIQKDKSDIAQLAAQIQALTGGAQVAPPPQQPMPAPAQPTQPTF